MEEISKEIDFNNWEDQYKGEVEIKKMTDFKVPINF